MTNGGEVAAVEEDEEEEEEDGNVTEALPVKRLQQAAARAGAVWPS